MYQMKIRLLPDRYIAPECEIAWLLCSYKMHPKFEAKIRELGFELTEVDPETTPYYGELKLLEFNTGLKPVSYNETTVEKKDEK